MTNLDAIIIIVAQLSLGLLALPITKHSGMPILERVLLWQAVILTMLINRGIEYVRSNN